jgi:hypothetical protein
VAKLFGIDVQKEVGKAMPRSSMFPMILTKLITDPTTTDDDGNVSVPYQCHGVMSDFDLDDLANNPLIQNNDKKIVLIGAPLAAIGVEPADKDTITDSDGTIYTIVKARTSSVRATWICHCRG